MQELHSTSDLWLSALFLAETDAELKEVQCSRNGRRTVIFTFSGEGLSRVARAYCKREAQANVTQLRERLNELRDHIFQARD